VASALDIRLLGPVRVLRDGIERPLPRSRKVRALLALLALEPGPVARSRLCDLLWDVPNDPRGELRWCLSKLRGVLDDEDHPRIVANTASTVSLALEDCEVDALEIARLVDSGLEESAIERLVHVESRMRGDFLEGMQLDGPEVSAWLLAQRERLRAAHVALLHELTRRAPPGSDELLLWLESWIGRAPFDVRAHELLLATLVHRGAMRDAEGHATRTIHAFEQEGYDWSPIRDAWQSARSAAAIPSIRIEVPSAVVARPAQRRVRRGSVVVMPFLAATDDSVQLAHGLTDDTITRLAKLRILFVIARGTSYVLRDRNIDAREAGRLLDVEYVVSGVVRRSANRLSVFVELVESEGAGIVWTDSFDGVLDEAFDVIDSIVDRVVASIAEEIERAECKRAIQRPPSSLDAWESYHRGLFHMYRFTGPDNELASRLFRDALALDPTFARAFAGLSFTHFQNVFLDLTPDRDRQLSLALSTASDSVAADERDPAAHWAMGRALWLRGDQTESVVELERCVELSPNFALGRYTLGFVHAQSGDPEIAIDEADQSRLLSPFDPLQFGMLGCRALAHMRLGEREEAVEWALKAVSRPNAHAHIVAIAATTLSLANHGDHARALVARIRTERPGYCVEDFLRAFRFSKEAEAIVRRAAKRIGFEGTG